MRHPQYVLLTRLFPSIHTSSQPSDVVDTSLPALVILGLKNVSNFELYLTCPAARQVPEGDGEGASSNCNPYYLKVEECFKCQILTCTYFALQQDKYLRAMVRVLQGQDDPAKYMAVSTLNMLLAHDPSTHWVLGRSGIVASLVEVLKQPLGPPEVKADATLGLKHLTSSSQRNRDALIQAKGLQYLISLVEVSTPETMDDGWWMGKKIDKWTISLPELSPVLLGLRCPVLAWRREASPHPCIEV